MISLFLTEPDPNLQCIICHEVLTNSQRTPCGHVFCGTCITDWLSLDKNTCVTCRKPLLFEDLQHDRVIDSLIGNLPMRCVNFATCPWRGKNSRSEVHLRECGEEKIQCPHTEFGCDFKNKRRHLATHLATCRFEKVKDVLCAQRDATTAARKRARDNELRVSQLEAVVQERSGRWLKNVNIDDKIDAKDVYGRWFETTVIGIPDDDSLELHFDGWSEKHDETIRRDCNPPRLAPLHTHSVQRRKRRRTIRNWRNFEEGDVIDAQDTCGTWYSAVVVEVNQEIQKIFVHFEEWPAMYDEWIDSNCRQRLAPRGTHSKLARNDNAGQRRDAREQSPSLSVAITPEVHA